MTIPRSLLAAQTSINVKGLTRTTIMILFLPREASFGGMFILDKRSLGTLWSHRNRLGILMIMKATQIAL